MTLNITTGVIKSGLVLTDATSSGAMVKTATGAVLRDSVIRGCAYRGVGDFATGTKLLNLVIAGNGKGSKPNEPDPQDSVYNGDGILVQSKGCEVGHCVIADNGDSPIFEHGIYVAGVARDAWLHHLVLVGNSCSGVKFQGTGVLEDCQISGSRLGIVFDDDQPGDVTVRRCTVQASEYAIQVDQNTRLSRYKSDYNVFAAGSKFNNKGKALTLSQWQAATGLDLHSVAA